MNSSLPMLSLMYVCVCVLCVVAYIRFRARLCQGPFISILLQRDTMSTECDVPISMGGEAELPHKLLNLEHRIFSGDVPI